MVIVVNPLETSGIDLCLSLIGAGFNRYGVTEEKNHVFLAAIEGVNVAKMLLGFVYESNAVVDIFFKTQQTEETVLDEQ